MGVACGAEAPDGVVDGENDGMPESVRRATLRYNSYAGLAARGGFALDAQVLEYRKLDPASPTLEDEIINDINGPQRVIPYIAGLGSAGYWWLQTEAVAAERVIATGEDLEEHGRILGRSVGLEYEEVYALDMELEVGGELLVYTAYAFHDEDEHTVELVDPVALGVGTVPEHLSRHAQVGESKDDTWVGCKAFHQKEMPQGEMEHMDGSCWDRASCANEAKGKIFCDTAAKGCPRSHGTTVQSGTCTNTAGGGFFCTGPEASSINSKETTVANGNCQDNINIELWWGPTASITWEISVSAGPVGVKFTGATPSHSVYQVYKLTMCCAAPAPKSCAQTDADATSEGEGDADADCDDPVPVPVPIPDAEPVPED